MHDGLRSARYGSPSGNGKGLPGDSSSSVAHRIVPLETRSLHTKCLRHPSKLFNFRPSIPVTNTSTHPNSPWFTCSLLVCTFVQFSSVPPRKMVLLEVPITFCTPGTHAVNDRRRTHGIDRNATRAPLGPALLETRPWQRGRLRLSRPHTHSFRYRPDPLPGAKPQGCRHDPAQHCLWGARHYGLLSPHARAQNSQDQPLCRAIFDLLGGLQRLRPSCKLGRL